jgi:hypothetical protein
MADEKLTFGDLTALQGTLTDTDLLAVRTAAGTRRTTFANLKASQEGYFKRVIDEYMEFDYEDLTAMRTDGELIAGQKYLLTDYRTIYRQDRGGGIYEDKTSDVEPLILTAVSTNEFSQVAYSPSFPQDIIWYNFDNVLSPENTTLFYADTERISKGFKGIIIRRIDTQKNINYSYDWRTMKWWREGNEVLTFADLATTYNIVSGSNCYDNVFGTNCYNSTFGNYCRRNTFGNYCHSSTFGNDCHSNTFGNFCHRNTFSSDCYSNTFGTSCYGNTFSSYCYSNTFGTSCYGNTFSSYCYSNTFDNFLQYADVKSSFSNATVTNPAIYGKNYNHTFYIDSAGAKKCYCITDGAITDVPLTEG